MDSWEIRLEMVESKEEDGGPVHVIISTHIDKKLIHIVAQRHPRQYSV